LKDGLLKNLGSRKVQIYKATITIHDFFFYVSREIRLGVPAEVINNTALLYAINSLISKSQRNASGNKPHYEEDYQLFPIYATPAGLLNSTEVAIGNSLKTFEHLTTTQKISYNSVDSTFLVSMETSVFHTRELKLAHPKLGSYMKYPPLTTFTFFTLGGLGARVVRLGKKLPPAVILYQRLEETELKQGFFKPDHPVAIRDMPGESKLIDGNIQFLPNGLIAVNAQIHGLYYQGKINGKTYYVAAPKQTMFPSVLFSEDK
jgi:CRISPR type I-D-associated protein Csc1